MSLTLVSMWLKISERWGKVDNYVDNPPYLGITPRFGTRINEFTKSRAEHSNLRNVPMIKIFKNNLSHKVYSRRIKFECSVRNSVDKLSSSTDSIIYT